MMEFKLRLALQMISAAVIVESTSRLAPRVVHSSAKCDTSFDWMQNQKAQSPCDVSAHVYAACLQPTFDFPALEAGNQYVLPNTTSQNACRCSWAAYNLVMGCSVCQGSSVANVPNWAAYIAGCPNFNTLTTYWPASIPLSSAAIPFWAGHDPASWSDGHFDVVEAKALAAEGKADLQTTPEKKSKAPIGPIVGGVIGGVLLVAAAVGIFIFMKIRRARAARLAHPSAGPNYEGKQNGNGMALNHARNFSDVSTKYATPPLDVAELGAVTQRPFSANSSNNMHSVSYFGSMGGSVDQIQQLPPGHRTQNSADTTIQNTIEPFMLQNSETPRHPTRKGSLPTMYPDYDSPSAPPAGAAYSIHSSQHHRTYPTPSPGEETASIVTTPPRPRMTPPAYSQTDHRTSTHVTTPPYANTPSSYTHRRGRNEKGSIDTDTSWGSQGSALPTGAILLNPDALVAASARRAGAPMSPPPREHNEPEM